MEGQNEDEPVSPIPPEPAQERRFGTPAFTIHCAIDHLEGSSRTIGRIEFEIGGARFGSFDEPCVISGVAVDLDVTIFDFEARKDLLLADLDPRAVLDRVYAAVYGPEGTEESYFWHRRFLWLEGREPFDAWRSVMLTRPEGRLIAWDRNGTDFHRSLVREEAYRGAIFELLGWLELLGVGSWEEPSCVVCAYGGDAGRRRTFEKARRRVAAAIARERKRAGSGEGSPPARP